MKQLDIKWIPVSKELPHNTVSVLVWISYPEDMEYEIVIGFYCIEDETWRLDDEYGTPIEDEVVAWMPLPKPILED